MKLSYITLFVGDLPACHHFYRDCLGLEALQEDPRFVQLSTGGGSILALHASADPARCSRGVNLHFEVSDVAEAMTRLRARGVTFAGEPRDEPWGARVARTRDPAGNSVEIVQWLRH